MASSGMPEIERPARKFPRASQPQSAVPRENGGNQVHVASNCALDDFSQHGKGSALVDLPMMLGWMHGLNVPWDTLRRLRNCRDNPFFCVLMLGKQTNGYVS